MRRLSLSITHKTLLAFLAVFVPVIVVFAITYQNTKRQVEDLIISNLKIMASDREGHVESFLQMVSNRMEDFASDGIIIRETERTGDGEKARFLSDYLKIQKIVLVTNIDRLIVMDRTGRVVASTMPMKDGEEYAKEDFFVEGLKGTAINERVIGNVPGITVSAPIKSRKTGRAAGVITGFVPFYNIEIMFEEELKKEMGEVRFKTIETVIVNSDRVMLTSSKFMSDTAFRLKIDTPPVRACADEGRNFSGFYRDYRGMEVAGASVCYHRMDWAIIAKIDKSEWSKSINSILRFAVYSLIVTFVVLLGLWVYFTRMVLKRLGAFRGAALEISKGNYDVKLPVKSQDEIGLLAEAFNAMASGIRERDGALRESGERLRGILDNTTNVVYLKDRDGKYILVNRMYEELFHVTNEEIRGKTDYDLFPKEFADRFRENDLKALASGEPIEFEEEAPLDGTVHFYISIKFRLLDEKGFPYAAGGISTDITELKNTVEALRKSEEGLALAQRTARLGSWEWDIKKGKHYWSDEVYRILGKEPGEFEPSLERFMRMVHPEDRDFVMRSIREAHEGKHYSLDYRVLADGQEKTVHADGQVEFDENGYPAKMTGTIQDITERKRMEEEREFLTQIIEATPDFVATADPEGNTFYYNRAARRLLGLREDEDITGRRIPDNHPEWATKMILEEGLPVAARVGVWWGETALINKKEGKIVPLSQVILAHRKPDGSVRFFSTIARDISERKRMEDELRRSEASLANAQKIANIGNWDWDIVNNVIHWSDGVYRIFGMRPQEVRPDYQAFLSFVHGDDREKVKKAVDEALKGNMTYAIDHRIIPHKGLERVVHEQGEVVWDKSGRPVRMTGTVQDITERKKAEEELRKLYGELEKRVAERTEDLAKAKSALEASYKELESFSYTVAHDLRSPLRIIDGFSTLVLKDYRGKALDEHGEGHLMRVREAARRMEKLIDGLFALSHAMGSRVEVEELDISDIASSVIADLRKSQPERRVEVIIAEGLKALGDHDLIRDVLENLLGNAWKFTSRKEEARIEFMSTGTEGEEVIFCVRDNGAGFEQKEAEAIFRAFTRLHRPEEFPGTGIGLATVARIINRHGGRIWAEGKTDEGASFYFSLKRSNAL